MTGHTAGSQRAFGQVKTESLASSSTNVPPQVAPIGVRAFNRVHLPLPWPLLEPFLATDGLFGAVMRFEPDKVMEIVSLGKAVHRADTMLVDALYQIAGDTDVKRSVLSVGHHVGVEALRHAGGFQV